MPATATPSSFSPTIQIQAANALEAVRKAQALTAIGQHIDLANLEMLAGKVTKPGVNAKIKQYAPFF